MRSLYVLAALLLAVVPAAAQSPSALPFSLELVERQVAQAQRIELGDATVADCRAYPGAKHATSSDSERSDVLLICASTTTSPPSDPCRHDRSSAKSRSPTSNGTATISRR